MLALSGVQFQEQLFRGHYQSIIGDVRWSLIENAAQQCRGNFAAVAGRQSVEGVEQSRVTPSTNAPG